MSKSISIIGGGLAGISSAVFLHDMGYEVNLYVSTSKTGGRVFSFEDKETGLTFDNGQHILAGWYKNTFELFEKMGKIPDLLLTQNLNVFFRDERHNDIEFFAKGDNPFVAVAKGFMNYNPLHFKDRIKLLRLRELIEVDFVDRIRGKKLDWLLDYLKQTENLIKYFWEPFAYAVFNTSPAYIDAELFYNVLVTAFENPLANTLVMPNENLDDMFANPFIKYANNKIGIHYNSQVNRLNVKDGKITDMLLSNGQVINSDFYVSAVPFYEFKNIFANEIFGKHFAEYEELKSSSILSVYLVPEKMPKGYNEKYYFGMVGIINGFIQWVFFKENYISVIISAPEFTVKGFKAMTKESVCEMAEKEIKDYFPEFRDVRFKRIKYFREKRATFLPETNSNKSRLDTECSIKNLFIAGDWTNTGLPSTIEGAVLSGKKCMEAISKV